MTLTRATQGPGTYSPKPDVREVTLIEQETLDALSSCFHLVTCGGRDVDVQQFALPLRCASGVPTAVDAAEKRKCLRHTGWGPMDDRNVHGLFPGAQRDGFDLH